MSFLLCLALVLFVAEEPPAWRYVASKKTVYSAKVDGKLEFGTVGEDGVFVPNEALRPKPTGKLTDPMPRSLWAGKPNEPVYQYRHGRLIPGTLDQERFLPEVGGVILDFKKFTYTPTARRIYNLPGRFVTAATYAEMKANGELTAEDR